MNKYPQLRYKGFDNTFEIKKMHEISNITTCSSKQKEASENGRFEIINAGTIKENKVDATLRCNISSDILNTNDIVMIKDCMAGGKSLGISSPIFCNDKYICSDHVFRISTREDDVKYISYTLNNRQKEIRKLGTGITIMGLSNSSISNIKLSLPFPSEQKKLAHLLYTIDLLIKEKEKEINNLEKVYYKIICRLFPKTGSQKLSDYCISIQAGKDKKHINGEYILYGSTGIIGNCEIPTYRGEKIIIARVGANTGYHYIINGNYGVTDNALLITTNEDLMPRYLYYYFNRINLKSLAFGSGQPLITGTMIKNVEISVPAISEQKVIVHTLDLLSASIATNYSEKNDLNLIKNYLLTKMLV